MSLSFETVDRPTSEPSQLSLESIELAKERAALLRELDSRIQDRQSAQQLEEEIVKHLHEDETVAQEELRSEEFAIRAPVIQTPAPRSGGAQGTREVSPARTCSPLRTPGRVSSASIRKAVLLTSKVLASGKKGSIRGFFTPPRGSAISDMPSEWELRLSQDMCGVGLQMVETRIGGQIEVVGLRPGSFVDQLQGVVQAGRQFVGGVVPPVARICMSLQEPRLGRTHRSAGRSRARTASLSKTLFGGVCAWKRAAD